MRHFLFASLTALSMAAQAQNFEQVQEIKDGWSMVVLPGLYELVKDGATHITRLQYDESEIALGHNPLSFMGGRSL